EKGLRGLLAQAESTDQVQVALAVRALEVVRQARPAADHRHQAALAREVVLVILEVLRQITDVLRQQSDLDLGRAAVVLVNSKLADDLAAALWGNRHSRFFSGGR